MRVRQCLPLLVAATLVFAAACSTAPPDRRAQVEELTQQIGTLPGVVATNYSFGDGGPSGPAFFEIDVDVAADITADQFAAVAARYLDGLGAVDYTGYAAEFDARRGWNVFTIGGLAATARDGILAQARSWMALRQRFTGSTVAVHAGEPPAGRIDLPDDADYTAVAATVGALGTSFGDLTAGTWTVSAGKQHPAEISTSRRLPTPQEMDVWRRLNADQSIPHADVLTINNRLTGPLWISEKIPAENPDMAMQLAQRHLPIVATLPAPVLYTASNQYRGHLGYYGQATGPVTITIGGCIKRSYRPGPAERALIEQYERCPIPAPR